MDKITKLPWTYDKERCDIKDANGIILATMALGQHSAIEKMVRAVNSHEGLVSALKLACLMLNDFAKLTNTKNDFNKSDNLHKILEALKAADGEGVK